MQVEYAQELLDSARRRISIEAPSRVDIRRSVSEAYYAVFHLLVGEAAVAITEDPQLAKCFGRVPTHKKLKEVCQIIEKEKPLRFTDNWKKEPPKELRTIALRVSQLYQRRIEADYSFTIDEESLDAVEQVAEAERTFEDWQRIRHDPTVRAFLLFLLIQEPKG
ncbi:MAG: hypothetical protein NW208_17565 [Bryobacter sp.]|nr:hypothetical protein [Bryobacter sp.]